MSMNQREKERKKERIREQIKIKADESVKFIGAENVIQFTDRGRKSMTINYHDYNGL